MTQRAGFRRTSRLAALLGCVCALAAPVFVSTAGADGNVGLTDLAVAGTTLQPAFSSQQTVYTAEVADATVSTQVTATPSPGASLTGTVNGAPFTVNGDVQLQPG